MEEGCDGELVAHLGFQVLYENAVLVAGDGYRGAGMDLGASLAVLYVLLVTHQVNLTYQEHCFYYCIRWNTIVAYNAYDK